MIIKNICYFCKALIKYEFQMISKPRNERLSGLRKEAPCHAMRKMFPAVTFKQPGRKRGQPLSRCTTLSQYTFIKKYKPA